MVKVVLIADMFEFINTLYLYHFQQMVLGKKTVKILLEPTSGDRFGYSVSLSSDGTIVAIGSPQELGGTSNTVSGYVSVYQYIPTGGGEGTGAWEQLGDDIDGGAVGDRSGWSVSLSSDGTIVAMGAHLMMKVLQVQVMLVMFVFFNIILLVVERALVLGNN